MSETLRRIEGEIRQFLRSIPAQEPLMWPVQVRVEHLPEWREHRATILHWPRMADLSPMDLPGESEAVTRHFRLLFRDWELEQDYTRTPITGNELISIVERTYASILLEHAVERDPAVVRAREQHHRAQLSRERHDQHATDRRLFTVEMDTRYRIAMELGITHEREAVRVTPDPIRPQSATEIRLRQREVENRISDGLRYAQAARGMEQAAYNAMMNALAQEFVRRIDPVEREAERAERRAAEERAEELLMAHLTDDQLVEYRDAGHFTVIGSDTGKRYRIKQGRQQNVFELDRRGEECMGWCFTPTGNLAAGDCMLAQKIALEGDETGALAVANPFGFPVNPYLYGNTPPGMGIAGLIQAENDRLLQAHYSEQLRMQIEMAQMQALERGREARSVAGPPPATPRARGWREVFDWGRL